jgi:putative membrane protein (TIGR04086 family)
MHNETAIGNGFFQVVKGVVFALAFSLLSAIIFASVLRFSGLSDKVIYPVNQTLKVLSAFLGAVFFVRGEKGLVKGVAIGLLFTALSYLTFSAIGGDFSLSWWIIAELVLSALAGVVGGVIGVNIRHD